MDPFVYTVRFTLHFIISYRYIVLVSRCASTLWMFLSMQELYYDTKASKELPSVRNGSQRILQGLHLINTGNCEVVGAVPTTCSYEYG